MEQLTAMNPLTLILVSVISSTIVGVSASYITSLLQFARHRAMDAEREKHLGIWRGSVDTKIGDHEERIDGLEREGVTREELGTAFNEMRAERQAMHEQNRQQLERIEEKLELERKEARDDRISIGDRVTEIALRLASLGLDERIPTARRRKRR